MKARHETLTEEEKLEDLTNRVMICTAKEILEEGTPEQREKFMELILEARYHWPEARSKPDNQDPETD